MRACPVPPLFPLVLAAALAAAPRAQVDWFAKPLPAGQGQAIAYDAGRERVVMFGGTEIDQVQRSTWEWDGIAWTHRVPRTSPPARGGAAMVYDMARGETVLFGGAPINSWGCSPTRGSGTERTGRR